MSYWLRQKSNKSIQIFQQLIAQQLKNIQGIKIEDWIDRND